MTEPAIRADLHQALDVQADLASEIALDLVLSVDHLAEAVDLVIGQVTHARVGRDVRGRQHAAGGRGSDAVDVGQADYHALLARDVDAGNASHDPSIPAAACAWG